MSKPRCAACECWKIDYPDGLMHAFAIAWHRGAAALLCDDQPQQNAVSTERALALPC